MAGKGSAGFLVSPPLTLHTGSSMNAFKGATRSAGRWLVLVGWTLSVLLVPAQVVRADGCDVSPGVVQEGDVITGTSLSDTIDCSGSDHAHRILGLGGDDLLTGSDSALDVIVPGEGDDTVDGGEGPHDVVEFGATAGPVKALPSGASNDGFGNDETAQYVGIEDLTGSPHGDALGGDEGPNVLLGMEGDDLLAGLAGADVIDGGAGIDTASFSASSSRVVVDLGTGVAKGEGPDALVRIQNVVGSAFDDLLTGNSGANRLTGGSGSDLLRGVNGSDGLVGGSGNDSLVGGPRADVLNGGTGRDACVEGTGSGRKSNCEVRAWGEALGVVLFEPTRHLVGVGFHESLFRSARALRPHGRLLLNDNPRKFNPPAERTDGLAYVVMGTRNRPTPATTSADIVVGSRSAVLSPVNGKVTLVRRYRLYCRSPDWQVVIRPAGRSDLLVMILHITNIRVKAGDRVVAGVTRVALSWSNDGHGAQENEYFPDQYPHVHIEMVRAKHAPIPGCRF
ncbi:MAG: calcium-binding protein [Actinomycetota bacterium]